MYCKVNKELVENYYITDNMLQNNKVEHLLCISFKEKTEMDGFCNNLYLKNNILVQLYDDKNEIITEYTSEIKECNISKYSDNKDNRIYVSCIVERS